MRTEKGFITLHREIMSWEWFKDANTFRVFIYLLLNANFVDGESRGRKIKRGELITSSAEIAEALGITPKEVRTALKHLTDTGEIEREASPRHSLIRILKYSAYQTRANRNEEIGQTESENWANERANVRQSENADIPTVSGNREKEKGKQKGKQNSKIGQTQSGEKGKLYNNNNIYNNNICYNNNTHARNEKIHNFPEHEVNFNEIAEAIKRKKAEGGA